MLGALEATELVASWTYAASCKARSTFVCYERRSNECAVSHIRNRCGKLIFYPNVYVSMLFRDARKCFYPCLAVSENLISYVSLRAIDAAVNALAVHSPSDSE